MITKRVPDLHPDSSKFYRIEWSAEELGDTTTIDSITWTVPTGLQPDETIQDGLTVGVRLSVTTGVLGDVFDVTCQVVTSQDETLHEIIRLTIGYDGH